MPIYEYECSQCHQTSDVLQKVNDPAPETCPRCGAQHTLSRLVSRTSFVLKGGGWYADLYSSSKPKSDGSESKPAAKPEASGPPASTPGGGTSGSGSGTSGTSGSGPVNSAPKVAAAKA
ncbi:MAG TPA: zinc ribbon domain-containing protein [Myxococcaceae bacterium]|nr:zinc ribbon domain-containing protein [Myxococcaceae bacterium]